MSDQKKTVKPPEPVLLCKNQQVTMYAYQLPFNRVQVMSNAFGCTVMEIHESTVIKGNRLEGKTRKGAK